MPSTSEKQARFMAAAAHDPEFAKKAGIAQDVAKEFNQADKGSDLLSRAMHFRKKIKEEQEVPAEKSSEKAGSKRGMKKATAEPVMIHQNDPMNTPDPDDGLADGEQIAKKRGTKVIDVYSEGSVPKTPADAVGTVAAKKARQRAILDRITSQSSNPSGGIFGGAGTSGLGTSESYLESITEGIVGDTKECLRESPSVSNAEKEWHKQFERHLRKKYSKVKVDRSISRLYYRGGCSPILGAMSYAKHHILKKD